MTLTFTDPEPNGRFFSLVPSAGGTIRRPVEPGHLEAGLWVATDITGQPQELIAYATTVWTQPVVDLFKAQLLAAYTPPIDPASMDTTNLNDALTQPGSVVRALGLVTFQEINNLRVLAGQTAYTMPQFVAALKANIR